MSEEKPIGRIEQLTDKPAITAAPAQDYPKVVMVTQAELDRLRGIEARAKKDLEQAEQWSDSFAQYVFDEDPKREYIAALKQILGITDEESD